MTFTFETQYNASATTAMARALRKTVRRKKSRRSHVLGILIIALAILLTWPQLKGEEPIDAKTLITWLAVLIMSLTLLFEDRLNAYFAEKRMLKTMQTSLSVFEEDSYTSATELGKTEFHYANIDGIAETEEYFVFLFGANHAQVYDKKQLSGGSPEAFRAFIEGKTGIKVQRI